jgi:hypothetical protein
VTLAFALVERGSATQDMHESLGAEWTPDRLPDVPHGSRGSLTELVGSLVRPGFLGAAVIWQQSRSPIHDSPIKTGAERFPLLYPDLWSFWLPLILVLLAAEMAFEVVKYRLGRWSVRLATANTVLGAIFAAPLVYLAADDRLLTPRRSRGSRTAGPRSTPAWPTPWCSSRPWGSGPGTASTAGARRSRSSSLGQQLAGGQLGWPTYDLAGPGIAVAPAPCLG